MKRALLLIDLQEDYLGATGLVPARGEVVARAAWLLARCRAAGVPVVHVWTTVHRDADRDRRPSHWRRDGVWRCVAGTPGHATPAALAPAPGEHVVHKTHFSAFSADGLDVWLRHRGVGEVWLAGVHAHACVRATALDADRLGFAVQVAADAVASDQPLHADETRRYLTRRCAAFVPAASLLAAPAETPPGARARGAVPSAPDRLPAAMIGGVPRQQHPERSVTLPHECPGERGRVLWHLPVAAQHEVDDAAKASHAAGVAWRASGVETRLALADRIAQGVERERDALAHRMAVEIGKPLADARLEVDFALALIRAARSRAASVLAHGDLVPTPAGIERRRPLGTVALVTPWNVPLAIPLGKLVPALLYGNTAVWKPAPAGSGVALELLRLLREAGTPPDAVAVLFGDHTTAERLMAHAAIDAVSLTGSSAVGTCAQAICAARRIPLQAELGGNNAAIVWSAGDRDDAAAKIAAGAFGSAGQRCTANRRVIVDARTADDFVARLLDATGALAWGDPLDPATRVGPLVSAAACERVAGVVERARAAGATVLKAPPHVAHERALARVGAYLPPTIVRCDDPRAEVVQEETFGPVLVVQSAGSLDEALALLNAVPQGLVAALFSGVREERARFLELAHAGILKIGSATAGVGAEPPFSGWKASGVGPAEHGSGDPEFYTRPQAVYVEDAPRRREVD